MNFCIPWWYTCFCMHENFRTRYKFNFVSMSLNTYCVIHTLSTNDSKQSWFLNYESHLLCCRPLTSSSQLLFFHLFDHLIFALCASAPLFPLSVGLWEWLISLFVLEAKRGMCTEHIFFVYGYRDEGGVSFLDVPEACLVFNFDKGSIFFKKTKLVFWGVFCNHKGFACRQKMPFSLGEWSMEILLCVWYQLFLALQVDSLHILDLMLALCSSLRDVGCIL